jgi:ribose/xylose/arabinose/galactoside ABC-type transport system permease subunit
VSTPPPAGTTPRPDIRAPAGTTPRPDIRAPAARPARADLGQRVRALLLSDYFVLYLSLAYFLALVPILPTLSTPGNIVNLMSNMWPLLVVAVGQTFVLTIAGIDLSQGAVMGLTSVVVAMLIATAAPATVLANAPIWGSLLTEQGGLLAGTPFATAVGIAAMLAVAALVGLFNGLAVARLSMPPFMVTLVTMIAVAAFAIWLTQSNNIRELPESFISLGKGDIVSVYLGPKLESQLPRREVYSFITWPMVIALATAVFAHILLNRTVFGRWVFAVGINRKAAEISGVPVARVIITVFVISAVCAAIASILYTARLETGRPTLGGGNFLLDVIGATVIGGTSLFGGKGKVIWTFFGVLFFVLLSNTLNLLNLSAFHIDMVKGGVILMAALLDVVRTRLMRSAT